MDNAIDALKIAFAVLVFVIGLSISMKAFSQAKAVSDEVFYMADKTNFYEYTSENKIPEGRIVSGETIIPTLYRYYKENFNVIILDLNGKELCTFNLEQEIKNYNKNYRDAPWLGNANIDTKLRVDIEVKGGSGTINGVPYTAQLSQKRVNGSNKIGILEYAKGKKFKETFREYRYSGKEITVDENGEIIYVETQVRNDDGTTEYIRNVIPDEETLELVKGNTKIEITYQELES